jgi:DNA-binding CsgD family transcriptional regulator
VLESAGALGWAAVGRDDLGRALGRRGSAQHLTPTEEKICELARSGLRNAEIAAQMFLSGKTVEANLSRAYRKLGIRSRTELASALPSAVPAEASQL